MNKSERKKLKRFAEVCMGSCGGCSHFVFFEGYCQKKKRKCAFTDPACDDYKKYKMGDKN